MEDLEVKMSCVEAIHRLRGLIDDVKPELRNQFTGEAYIAGGAIASLLRGETPKDYDIFLRNEDTVTTISAALSEAGKVACCTERALSFDLDGINIQLVTAHWGAPEFMVAKFDFVHCMGYYDYLHNELVAIQVVKDACENSRIVYCPAANPVRSFVRAIKLEARGWTLPQEQVLKIVREIQGLDLSTHTAVATELSSWY